MKKFILAVAAISLIGTASFAATGADKDKAEKLKSLNEECKTEMTEMGLEADQAKTFCDCYTKQIGEKLTLDEINSLDELKNNEAEPSPELVSKLQEAMAPCAEALQ